MLSRREIAILNHKKKIEKTDEYEYIASYFGGDILPNRKINTNRVFVLVKHKYCGQENLTLFTQFRESKKKIYSCKECCGSYEKSFAYYIEQELGLDIKDVWDFEQNTVNPYHISKHKNIKVWIKCLETDYHGSYEIDCRNFVNGNRCGYCAPRSDDKIHRIDSFGYNFPSYLNYWHKDNKRNPFQITCKSDYLAKFSCDKCNSIFEKRIAYVTQRGEWCPLCSHSKGEQRVLNWIKSKDIKYIHDKPVFDNLIGERGGILRPDFILPDHKIWIEYDGEFHFMPIQGKKKLERQKYHDQLKNEYAKKHDWKMIRIPYTEFDNIENILDKFINVEVRS